MGYRHHTRLPHEEDPQVVTSPADYSDEPPPPLGRFRRFWLRWTAPYVTSDSYTEYELCERQL